MQGKPKIKHKLFQNTFQYLPNQREIITQMEDVRESASLRASWKMQRKGILAAGRASLIPLALSFHTLGKSGLETPSSHASAHRPSQDR